jgi:hypothetical protein
MRIPLLLPLFLFLCVARSEDQEVESPWPFLVGEYEVIGRVCDSNVTYSGSVSIRAEGGDFIVTRNVAGKEIIGRGLVESITPDKISIFRVTFAEDGIQYVVTYLLGTDLDNDGRLSGYVLPLGYSGLRPGKEALFALKKGEMKPNKAMETIPVAVTDRADARSAPSTSMSHLRR